MFRVLSLPTLVNKAPQQHQLANTHQRTSLDTQRRTEEQRVSICKCSLPVPPTPLPGPSTLASVPLPLSQHVHSPHISRSVCNMTAMSFQSQTTSESVSYHTTGSTGMSSGGIHWSSVKRDNERSRLACSSSSSKIINTMDSTNTSGPAVQTHTSAGAGTYFSATWTASELLQRLVSADRAQWLHRVYLTRDALMTLDEFGFVQVITPCPTTADALSFCEQTECQRWNRIVRYRETHAHSWELVGISREEPEELELLQASDLPYLELLPMQQQPLVRRSLPSPSLDTLPAVWRWAQATAADFILEHPPTTTTQQQCGVECTETLSTSEDVLMQHKVLWPAQLYSNHTLRSHSGFSLQGPGETSLPRTRSCIRVSTGGSTGVFPRSPSGTALAAQLAQWLALKAKEVTTPWHTTCLEQQQRGGVGPASQSSLLCVGNLVMA